MMSMDPRKLSGMAMGRELRIVADDAAAREGRVARDQDLAHFHFGAFVDVEAELYRVRARIRSYVGFTTANCRPCSASNSFRTTSAFLMRVGSNWLSIDNPTLRSLNLSRMSDSETDLLPLYSMRRMIGRSVTKKNHDLGVGLNRENPGPQAGCLQKYWYSTGRENRGEGIFVQRIARHGKRCGPAVSRYGSSGFLENRRDR